MAQKIMDSAEKKREQKKREVGFLSKPSPGIREMMHGMLSGPEPYSHVKNWVKMNASASLFLAPHLFSYQVASTLIGRASAKLSYPQKVLVIMGCASVVFLLARIIIQKIMLYCQPGDPTLRVVQKSSLKKVRQKNLAYLDRWQGKELDPFLKRILRAPLFTEDFILRNCLCPRKNTLSLAPYLLPIQDELDPFVTTQSNPQVDHVQMIFMWKRIRYLLRQHISNLYNACYPAIQQNLKSSDDVEGIQNSLNKTNHFSARLLIKRQDINEQLPFPGYEIPDELTLHIFSFLPPEDLGRSCCTSRAWNRLGGDESLWQAFAKLFPLSSDISSLTDPFSIRLWKKYESFIDSQIQKSYSVLLEELKEADPTKRIEVESTSYKKRYREFLKSVQGKPKTCAYTKFDYVFKKFTREHDMDDKVMKRLKKWTGSIEGLPEICLYTAIENERAKLAYDASTNESSSLKGKERL